MKGLVDVLRANYPTVERLVGDEWFQSAALAYARGNLPQQAPLALYGADFAEFMQQSPVSNELPYLAAVARIDRYWTEAHFAADAPALRAAQLALVAAMELPAMQLRLHPATRLACVPHSAFSIWQHNRPPATPPVELLITEVTEYVLITRAQGEVMVAQIEFADHAFLTQLQAGATLGAAALAVLEQQSTADIAAILARAIAAGVFSDELASINQ
jgi:hypothetical protein